MFSNKEEKFEASNKNYLLIVVALMIVAALGLSIAGLFKKGETSENKVSEFKKENVEENIQTKESSSQTYLASAVLNVEEGDNVIGSKDAKLKIFVYEDYDDILSAKFNDTINRLITLKSENIAFVIRPFISSARSAELALAVECAGDAGEWQIMRGMILNNLLGKEKIDREIEPGKEIYYYAEKLELNLENFSACLTNNQKSGRIEQLASTALQYNVQGSPTVFIGDEVIFGARPFEDYTDSNGDNIEGLKTIVDRLAEDN